MRGTAGCTTGSPRPQPVPNFAETRFLASDHSCWGNRIKIVRYGTSPKRRIFAVAYGCLRVANFGE
jgi:hypothetical protein